MASSGRILRLSLYLLIIGIGLIGAAGGALVFRFWLFLHLPGGPDRAAHYLTIRQGMNATAIARLLHSEGVVSDSMGFRFLSWLRRSGDKLRAGDYLLSSLLTPDQVLDKLVYGKGIALRVTFPEGSTIYDVARTLSRKGLAPERDILDLAASREFIEKEGLHVPTLEGYLFPDTYFFERSQGIRDALSRMVREFRRHFPDAWRERAGQLGLSVQEVVILASMVEKEAKLDGERPLIAAVFMNRLKQNMLLQSDPTAVYDLPGFSGPVRKAHLERESPYNTYRNPGLPAGPICNPGAKSMEAVLFHQDVPYLYFVSNNDGSHQFSTSFAEHLQAVERYREKRSAQPEIDPGGQPSNGDATAGSPGGSQSAQSPK